MCKFMSSFSTHSADIVGAKKKNQNLEMFLQPCKDEKTYYRVRLLGFSSSVGRTDPHINRFVHSAWVTDPKTGKKRLKKIVCSRSTPWVETDGPKQSSCKICNYANQQWAIYNESGKSDKTALAKAMQLKSTFEAIVPVYVRNDPNYERNNGKFKVIIFNDIETYNEFRDKCKAMNKIVPIFNGEKAVDCLIHVSRIEETAKNGKTYAKTDIDKIKFSTEPKDIPAINQKTIDVFPFDETYYVASDDEEIDAFYDAHCAISNDDIPDDDEIPVYKHDNEEVKTSNVKIPSNVIEKKPSSDENNDDVPEDDLDELIADKPKETAKIDDLATDPDEDGLVEESKPNDGEDVDSEDLLADLGI